MAWIRSAPATYTYLFALVVTSWSLRNVDPRLADALVRSQSTNLDNLTDRPVSVLIASAFWTSGAWLPWQLLLRLSLVMAPVERRLGARRTVLLFATGHVLATLIVAVGLNYGVSHRLLDHSIARASDVGVSYGLMTIAGAMTGLLVPRFWRPVWVLALMGLITAGAVQGPTFTDAGHAVSLCIGLASLPLVARWQKRSVPAALLGGEPIRFPPRPLQRAVRLSRSTSTRPGASSRASWVRSRS